MKLIIDIPEETYQRIKEYYERYDIVEATYSYIYYGIPFDEQEPCEDVISIETVIEWLKDKDIIKLFSQEKMARKELKVLQSVMQEPKTGHWIGDNQAFYIYAKCSECGSIHDTATNYCPECGCLMDRTEFDEYVKAEGL